MGVLRLAAIFDIELLQEASNNLRNLYERWRKRSRGDVNGRDEADKEVSDINRFAEELDGLGSNIKFGLTYRIERAAYYFDLLKVPRATCARDWLMDSSHIQTLCVGKWEERSSLFDGLACDIENCAVKSNSYWSEKRTEGMRTMARQQLE